MIQRMSIAEIEGQRGPPAEPAARDAAGCCAGARGSGKWGRSPMPKPTAGWHSRPAVGDGEVAGARPCFSGRSLPRRIVKRGPREERYDVMSATNCAETGLGTHCCN